MPITFQAALGVVLILVAALAYETVRINQPGDGNPAAFRRAGGAQGARVAACLGASIVHGRVSVDFVALLRRRMPGWAFVNAGVSGDLAWNALQRLPDVLACRPEAVVVLVGTNDVQATLSESVRRLAVRSKKLPRDPSLGWYAENLAGIVTRVREAGARAALCSLPPLGEDLESPANARVREFNTAIERVAAEQGAAYLPVYERLAEALEGAANGGRGRAYSGSPALVMAAGVQHLLLGQSLDAISRRNGLTVTTDLIHLNSRSAEIVAAEVEGFLREEPKNP